jgi:3-oxoacyl-[acyl-carrier protein] reductase
MPDFSALQTGDVAYVTKTITATEIRRFAELADDFNPLHLDAEFAGRTGFRQPVAHGMLLASYLSGLVGMHLPGPGALWTRQELRWPAPVFAGDTVRIELRVTHKSEGARAVTVQVTAVNQNGTKVMEGEGVVMMVETRQATVSRGLRGRLALVTGASRGIGAAVARALGEAGAAVGVHYLNGREGAQEVQGTIEAAGGRAITVRADLRDAAAIEHAIESLQEQHGAAVSVLVNNAAAPAPPRAFLETQWEDFQNVLEVQLRGAYLCCRAVLPGMVAAHAGSIVNIGAAAARGVPEPRRGAFTVAKAALHGLTRSLAAEYGPQGIQVNTVSPGTTETDSATAGQDRMRKVQAMQTPLRRLALPADVAGAVVFLCSEAGQYVTGADLPVCGGWSM